MALRDAFRDAARSAVAAVGDVAVSTNYLSHSTTIYDTSTGAVTATFATQAGVRVVFDEFRIFQVDGVAVKPEDKKALIPALSLGSLVPAAEDQIIEGGTTWEVVKVRVDPAEALYEVHVRKP